MRFDKVLDSRLTYLLDFVIKNKIEGGRFNVHSAIAPANSYTCPRRLETALVAPRFEVVLGRREASPGGTLGS